MDKKIEPKFVRNVDGVPCITLVEHEYLMSNRPQPAQKPVAWMDNDGNISDNNDHNCFPIPLFTYPPARKPLPFNKKDLAELDNNLVLAYKLGWKSAEEAHGITGN